jgi:lipoprotein-releasing system permease protein
MKKKNPILRIALTHLFSKKRQTVVAMLGVTFGIAIFIFQGGLMTGFQKTFIDQTVNTTANIRIYNEPKKERPFLITEVYASGEWLVVRNQKPREELPGIKNASAIVAELEKNPEITGVSPFLSSQVIFKLGLAEVSGRVSGVDIERENLIFDVEENMVEGSISKLATMNNGIILGDGLAELLGAKMNDNILLISPMGVSVEVKVAGINHSGLTEVDKQRAYLSIRNTQKLLLADGSYITDINLKLKDFNKAEILARELEKKFGYRCLDWKEANVNVFGIFKIQNLITYLIIISILVVSGFGIFNILMMIIYEKLPDIAILKAVGYKDRDIMKIFLTESLIIGFTGGIFGLVLGFLLQQIIGNIEMDIKGFVSMKYLQFNNSPIFFVSAFIFGLVATALAGYFPARKASRVDAIDIIRAK